MTVLRRLLFACALVLPLALLAGPVAACGEPESAASPVPVAPVPAVPDVPHVVVGGTTVAVEVAATPADRARGLGGHTPLGEFEGMLFVFERPGHHAFWMKGMSFPIDIIWIDDGRVVHVEAHVPPPDPGSSDLTLPVYVPSAPARYVLEVTAGFTERHGIDAGASVEIYGVSTD